MMSGIRPTFRIDMRGDWRLSTRSMEVRQRSSFAGPLESERSEWCKTSLDNIPHGHMKSIPLMKWPA